MARPDHSGQLAERLQYCKPLACYALRPPMLPFVHDRQRRRPDPVAATVAPLWPTALLCLLLALVVYLPAALRAQFLGFDDNFFFGPNNPEFQAGFASVLDASQPIANAFLPVAHASLWLDFACTQSAPLWPHVHALLLHALVGFVLVRLLLQLGASRVVAHAAGALFVVHPALAESVAWVSGRKDLLSGLFTFLALHQCAVVARRPAWWRMVGIGLLAALAMYSKATAVVLPLLAAAVCWQVGGQRRRWFTVALLLAVVVPIALHHQAIAAGQGTLVGGSAMDRLCQVPGSFVHYVHTAMWPVQLNVLYPEVQTLERFRGASGLHAAMLAAFVLAAVAALCARSWRLVGCGLAFFVLAWLPFNTAFPASSIAAADRYLYLALPGLCLAVVAALVRLAPRYGGHVAIAAVLPLLWLAGGRAQTFADDDTLWQTSLATEPANAVAHYNLVFAQLQRGPAPLEEVRRHLEAAVQASRYPIHELRARQLLVRVALMDADYARAASEAKAAIAAARAQLALETSASRTSEATGLLLQSLLAAFEPLQLVGDEATAKLCHQEAKSLASAHPDVVAFGAMLDLAACRDELVAKAAAGQPPFLAGDDARGKAADEALAAALAIDNHHAPLLCAQAEWERARDRVISALRFYRLAQAADPNCIQAWLGAARMMRERNGWPAAEDYAKRGLAVRSDPSLRQELALAMIGQGKLEEAELHLEAYLRLRPEDKDTAKVLSNVLIGRAYAKLTDGGDVAAVQKLVDRALAYNPNEVKAHLVLGRMAKDDQRLADAVHHFERAWKQMPTYEEARQLYVEALARLGYEHLLRRNEDAALAAFGRCIEVAPADFDTSEMQGHLQRAWSRHEESGVQKLRAGDRDGAATAFRKCLSIMPDQHWAAWLLATALHDMPGADLVEVERLCRVAIAWQEKHGLDHSGQVLLLASTLVRAGRGADAKALASEYLRAPRPDAKPQVIQALQQLVGG